MPNYQNGKIYKITSGDLVYIGSTCEPTLSRRLSGHVGDYKRFQLGSRPRYTATSLIETGQYEITLIELFPCGSKDELTARERFHIETNVCVNKIIPTRTDKEYREANKEVLVKNAKIYRKANIEKNNEYRKAYREKNAEKYKEKTKEYNDKNVEKRKARYQEKKAKALQEAGETLSLV